MNEKESTALKIIECIALLVLIIIPVIAGLVVYFVCIPVFQRMIARPNVVITGVDVQGYWEGLNYEALVTATLYNSGTSDGYVTVKLSIECDNYERGSSLKTAYVPVKQSVKVSASLDADAFKTIYGKAEIIDQWK